MKNIFFILLASLFFFFPINAKAEEQVDLYLFYGRECPHCEAEIEYLDELQKDYPELVIHKYEVWHDSDNRDLFAKVAEAYDKDALSVPFTVIGGRTFTGFSEYVENNLEDAIIEAKNSCSLDVVQSIISGEDEVTCEEDSTNDQTIKIPFLKEINLNKLSLPILTIVVGLIDGFNPCAMWILIFLISMLIGMKDKKKMWILGVTFIVTSSLVYFAFMAAWLNVALMLGTILLVRILIGVFGVGAGSLSIKKYFDERKKEAGCDVVDKKKRVKIINKIKDIIKEKKFIISLLGIMVLAISVNLVELLCSLGLPAVYTEILTMSDLPKLSYYLYLLLYVLFFMLDDIIIFAIAVITFKVTGISTKFTKYSHLIGGIIMLIIGILLIVNPGLLMFG